MHQVHWLGCIKVVHASTPHGMRPCNFLHQGAWRQEVHCLWGAAVKSILQTALTLGTC